MDPSSSNLPSFTIEIDKKSNNDLSLKPSVKSYANRVFQESTIGMVSSIFTTHDKYRRFFKVFLSLLCIVGFIYHCVSFLNHVLGYPEVVNISPDRSETYNMPAFTYCSNNPIRRSVFCSFKPEYCDMPSKKFCKKFISYCGANATLKPREEYYHFLPGRFQMKWLLKFGKPPNLFHSSREKNKTSGPFFRSTINKRKLFPCYSKNSAVESNRQPLQKRRSHDTFLRYDDFMHFYLNETEMMNPRSEPGVYFSVHSPFQAENPLDKGIFLKGGRTYKLFVEMTNYVRHVIKINKTKGGKRKIKSKKGKKDASQDDNNEKLDYA